MRGRGPFAPLHLLQDRWYDKEEEGMGGLEVNVLVKQVELCLTAILSFINPPPQYFHWHCLGK